MDLKDFIKDAEQNQELVTAKLNREEEEGRAKHKRKSERWARVRNAYTELEKHFKAFQKVELDKLYYPYKINGVYTVKRQFHKFFIHKQQRGEYGINTHFESMDGHYCLNVDIFDNASYGQPMIQIALNPKTDELWFLFETEYRTHREAEKWLNIEEGYGYKEKPFGVKTLRFDTLEHLKDYLTQFLKDTINIESLKRENGLSKVLKFA
jgi:hypothetical protein